MKQSKEKATQNLLLKPKSLLLKIEKLLRSNSHIYLQFVRQKPSKTDEILSLKTPESLKEKSEAPFDQLGKIHMNTMWTLKDLENHLKLPQPNSIEAPHRQ